MYALKLWYLGKPSGSAVLRTLNVVINHCPPVPRRNYKKFIDVKREMQKDVLLYTHNRTKIFLLLNLFSATQLLSWSYLGYFVLSVINMEDIKVKSGFWNWLYTTEKKHHKILGSVAIAFGILFFSCVTFYTTRSIKSILLHKGGQNLTIETYRFPGFKNKQKVPLSEISSTESRDQARSFLAIKIKNRPLFYLMDMKGEFKHPMLFDYTVGIKRNF